MELLGAIPLLLSLVTAGLACMFYWYSRLFIPVGGDRRLAVGICIFLNAHLSLLFFAIANIFVLIGFFHLEYPNSPKGLYPKMLYRSTTIVEFLLFLFVLQGYFAKYYLFIPL